MLVSLSVKNLALAEQVHIEFGPGLNVVTGETGAGKSMLIGALRLLTGERADRTLIRTGADHCSAEAVYQLDDAGPVDSLLKATGVDPCEDGQLILRRTLKEKGGQAFINGCSCTAALLKQVGERLLDMHGPYDHQSLLKSETQLDILDAFGAASKAHAVYAKVFEERRILIQRKAELEAVGSVTEQIEFLTWRINEIEAAAIEPGEEDRLLEEHNLQANAQSILELANMTTDHLDDGEMSAFDNLVSVQHALTELARLYPEAETWRKEAESIAIQIKELSSSIHSDASRIEGDPARLSWLDQRLADIREMKRKYGPEEKDVLHTLDEAARQRADLSRRDEQLETLSGELEAVDKRLQTAGKALSKKRQSAADKLAREVTAHLRDLGFNQAAFHVELQTGDPRASGLDEIEFGFAPNPGEAMRPLRQIASSGEISRVMLASKAVLAKHDPVALLVFDEIDANVGGETGTAIGEKMHEVAAHHQIVAITHLPQVAVHGRQHFAVRKSVQGKRTFTEVEALEDEARVEEIARMLGGKDHTRVTMDHARELLKS